MQIYRIRVSYKLDGLPCGHDVETYATDASHACNKVLAALKRVIPDHTDASAHLLTDESPVVLALQEAA